MSKRYQIWDKTSNVITPSGEEFTAEQWLARYPWAKYTKMMIGGGVINGSCAIALDDYVDMLQKDGADFSACETDEDICAAIEAFEDERNAAPMEPSTDERIAAALEYQVMSSLPDEE